MRLFHRFIAASACGIALLCQSPAFASDSGAPPQSTDIDCSQPFGPILADDSPNLAYFQALAQRGKDAPLEDFMKFWYPDQKTETPNLTFLKQCKDNSSACETTRINVDTFYSWGPEAKLKNMQATLPDGGVWEGNPNPGYTLDTLFTAIGSYGYGLIPVRIRAKARSVPVNYLGGDQNFESAREIESWSFGTPEHYDEIVRDYQRYKSGGLWVGYFAVHTWDGYKMGHSPDDDIFRDELFMKDILDGHYFSEENLKASMLKMVQMILNGEGRIYYAKGQCRNRKLEFETGLPTYINPNKLEATGN